MLRRILITSLLALFILVTGSSCERTPPEPVEPGIYIYPTFVSEGDRGLKDLDLTVKLFPARSVPIHVDYEIVPADSISTEDLPAIESLQAVSDKIKSLAMEAVIDDDYTATIKDTLTFEPGEIEKTITLRVKGDTHYERQDVIVVKLSNSETDIKLDTAVGVIENDDPPPVAKLTGDGISTIVEADSETRKLLVEFDVGSGIDTEMSFSWATKDVFAGSEGTAIFRGDYSVYDESNTQLFTGGSFVIPAFTTSASFVMKTVDDGLDEVAEAINISLVAAAASSDDVIVDSVDNSVAYSIDANTESGTGMKALSDTGVTELVDLADASLDAQQDPNQGYDSSDNNDSDGYNGFKYTKLDAEGKTTTQDVWSCVRDERTGLVWEVKSAESTGYQSKVNYVYWFESDPKSNGSNPGELGGENCEITDNCNTLFVAAQANLNKLCGKTGWRVPDIHELRSLAYYGSHERSVDTLAIDQRYFPNVRSDRTYWSSTTSAGNTGHAYAIRFGKTADDSIDLKNKTVNVVRLVTDQ